ncbi:UDP-2,4-diacetamido-2,4,6-trideoxy-beta-L-altropyranose hydrolase [Methylophaga sp.]|uniref:UDP-2,4-diacetamido-2,4, 6-trideoxy-beta-L-altropyranose hydrolase n=1 Tax=Methylophaga sp. TaxID=2024840 RepID=UPI003A8D8FB5
MSNQKHVVFRADASSLIGGGHISRCLTLANALSERNWRCTFICSEQSVLAFPALGKAEHSLIILPDENRLEPIIDLPFGQADLLVIDHYELGFEFEKDTRRWANSILVIEDMPTRKHDCDFLLDQTLGRSCEEYLGFVPINTHLLLGPKYALLKSDFSVAREGITKSQRQGEIRKILVSIGGSDPKDITSTALMAIDTAGLDVEVDVVLGGESPNLSVVKALVAHLGAKYKLHIDTTKMSVLMSAADLAIGACGVTSWERCSVSLPAIAVVIADNQRQIAQSLSDKGAIVYAGDWTELSVSLLAKLLVDLASSREIMKSMSLRAGEVCDGQGVNRLLRELTDL